MNRHIINFFFAFTVLLSIGCLRQTSKLIIDGKTLYRGSIEKGNISLELNPDMTFKFQVNRSLDFRDSEGTWSLKSDTLFLNSYKHFQTGYISDTNQKHLKGKPNFSFIYLDEQGTPYSDELVRVVTASGERSEAVTDFFGEAVFSLSDNNKIDTILFSKFDHDFTIVVNQGMNYVKTTLVQEDLGKLYFNPEYFLCKGNKISSSDGYWTLKNE